MVGKLFWRREDGGWRWGWWGCWRKGGWVEGRRREEEVEGIEKKVLERKGKERGGEGREEEVGEWV